MDDGAVEQPTERGREEELLARCIERFAELGPAAVDEVTDGDAQLSLRLRARLRTLQKRLHLLSSD